MHECIAKHLDMLGKKAKDKVTGYEGVIDGISFDLYGCIQASIKPPMTKDGEVPQGYWFDVTRLEIKSNKRVVEQPRFDLGYVAEGRKGAAPKPTQRA